VNGDGYADVIVGAQAHLGPPQAPSQAPDSTIAIRGETVSSAGDVNGDGYADVVVGCPYEGVVRDSPTVLDGLDPRGEWTLHLEPNDELTLNPWSLDFEGYGTVSSADTPIQSRGIIMSTIEVFDTFTVTDLNVAVDISLRDTAACMVIDVVSPTGAFVRQGNRHKNAAFLSIGPLVASNCRIP